MTRNEARIAENLTPLTGLDEPLRQLNMGEEGAAEDLEIDAEPAIATPDEFMKIIARDIVKWTGVAKQAGIKLH